MKFEFPDTGEGVTEGQFLEWEIEVGDKVEEDQILGEAETDKAVVDIPAPSDGVVKDLKVSPGDKVEVGEVIMELDENSEEGKQDNSTEEDKRSNTSSEVNSGDNADAIMGGRPSASSYDDDEKDKEQQKESQENTDETILALPKVRKLAEDKGVDLASLDVSGRIREEDVLKASGESDNGVAESKNAENKEDEAVAEDKTSEPDSNQQTSDAKARPSVRKLARKHDIEISMVDGSGRGGEVTREDILKAAGEPKDAESKTAQTREENSSHSSTKHEDGADIERVKMSGIRKATANKMEKSRFTAPHVTHVEKADITDLVELRESVKGDVDAHITYLPFIMKALIAGLKEHPNLNAELDEENNEIIRKKFYEFNIAVDTEKGLLIPKIEDIDDKNLVELAESISNKVEKAQNNKLSAEEMNNGTFSITNLGVIGGEEFTPIINYPQAAILGIGKIQETAEVVNGEVVPRNTVKLSLSYDHRIVDGAEAARFMNKVVENLENPHELILEL